MQNDDWVYWMWARVIKFRVWRQRCEKKVSSVTHYVDMSRHKLNIDLTLFCSLQQNSRPMSLRPLHLVSMDNRLRMKMLTCVELETKFSSQHLSSAWNSRFLYSCRSWRRSWELGEGLWFKNRTKSDLFSLQLINICFRFVSKEIDAQFRAIIDQLLQNREVDEKDVKRDDLFQVLMGLREKYGKTEFSDGIMAGHSMTFLVSSWLNFIKRISLENY